MAQQRQPRSARGDELAKRWGLNVRHALYRRTGNWYHHLTRFPGALLDAEGYVVFATEEDFQTCPGLQLGKEASAPRGIKSIPGYVRVVPSTEATTVEALVVEAVVRPRNYVGGQGFVTSPEYRKAIELHAMRLALEHYSRAWPEVQDVSATEPFDLLCLGNGRQLRVEVKGTASSGECVLLTRNEVRHARTYRGQIALFLVSHVEIDSSGAARGGRIVQFEPWDIDRNRLEPIAYECYLAAEGRMLEEAPNNSVEPTPEERRGSR